MKTKTKQTNKRTSDHSGALVSLTGALSTLSSLLEGVSLLQLPLLLPAWMLPLLLLEEMLSSWWENEVEDEDEEEDDEEKVEEDGVGVEAGSPGAGTTRDTGGMVACCSHTTRKVMLSPPIPCDPRGSFARQRFMTAWTTSSRDICSPSTFSRTKSQASWLVSTSQIPSHAKMKNSSSSGWISNISMSGSAVIICSSGGKCLTCLYFKSPNERDKLRLPFTLPTILTKPPAFLIRLISRS